VAQLWLWQGDDGLYAVGVFRTLVAGRSARFVTPIVLGRGERDGDAWRFAWEQDAGAAEARVRVHPEGEGVALEVLRLGSRDGWPLRTLPAGAIFQDDVIELASRTSPADWQHWFDNLLVAHFSSGEIPAN
jgi:hypothetical protein